ncbi:ABC transporter related protein [Solidesulfovibrio fructosivorans JJ]]|uniref:ABC transporter related protein n=1 Tax=Solidesulfovibrio fructosivorans JJ] TaxID=596151 RepID=E1JWS8_SOLFR|nr:ABC transporter ATP-binding protein [Solidesulfovibrio fructosivorans]EFL51132.1 ABC transporter related protein [Solidesulfovibrio fructosivorans JJ]]
MDAVAVSNLAFSYNGRAVLCDVSFTVAPGGLACLLGPNGCGKTTLLRLILGLLSPGSGDARIEGRDVAASSPRELAKLAAYVPQLSQPAFAYSAFETVLMGRAARARAFGRPGKDDRDIARAAMARFGVDRFADTPLTRLSGGQRQLVMLARALAQETPVLVMDEPVNGLDFGNQARFLEIVRELCDEGRTCLMTTHFPDHALWVADRVVMMRSGHVLADAAPAEAVTSRNLGRLYDAAIEVHPLNEHMRVCVPTRMRRVLRHPGKKRAIPLSAAGQVPNAAPTRSRHVRNDF